MMPDADSDLPRLETDAAESPLQRALADEHTDIRELAERAERARPTDEDPRRQYRLIDTFTAVLCRHLAAVDDVLLPRAGKATSDGPAMVHDYVRHARGLENTLHLLKAKLYGDATALHRTWDEVWNATDEWLDDHIGHEQVLIEVMAERLTGDEARELAAELHAIEERSPTRPHPYTPHTGVAGRVAHRLWARVDNFWDDAEGRIVPHRRRGASPRRNSLLSRYVTGMAVQRPGDGRDERRHEVSP